MYENTDIASYGNNQMNDLSSLFNPMPYNQQGNFVTGDSLSSLFGSNNIDTGFGLKDLGGIPGLMDITKTLGNLFLGFGQQNRAKDALNFQKNAYAQNIKNQTQAYNTNLEDRIKSRYVMEGKTQQEADKYLNSNRL